LEGREMSRRKMGRMEMTDGHNKKRVTGWLAGTPRTQPGKFTENRGRYEERFDEKETAQAYISLLVSAPLQVYGPTTVPLRTAWAGPIMTCWLHTRTASPTIPRCRNDCSAQAREASESGVGRVGGISQVGWLAGWLDSWMPFRSTAAAAAAAAAAARMHE
jgi:hypothetical protein